MPPEDPFPAAIDDVVKVYNNLLNKYPSKNLGIGGTSAGGGLALSCIYKFQELNIELPGAIFAGTPWSDLTKTGDSHFTNEGIDHVLVSYDTWLKDAAEIYVGNNDFKNPMISPIYGDFKSFPPTYIVTGTRDLFLSDAVRTHRKLKLADVIVELNVFEGVSHADFMISYDTPESVQVYKELGDFLKQHLK
jgi:acetyl esterase/lipase